MSQALMLTISLIFSSLFFVCLWYTITWFPQYGNHAFSAILQEQLHINSSMVSQPFKFFIWTAESFSANEGGIHQVSYGSVSTESKQQSRTSLAQNYESSLHFSLSLIQWDYSTTKSINSILWILVESFVFKIPSDALFWVKTRGGILCRRHW